MTFPTKYYSLIAFAVGLVTSAFGQAPTAPVQVSVESESKDLAKGYAMAFAQLSRPPLTIAFQKEGVLRVLEDVKQVRASEGVLVIEVGRGLLYIVNPKDVVYLTDGPQLIKK